MYSETEITINRMRSNPTFFGDLREREHMGLQLSTRKMTNL